jgi:hypothetical protein
MQRLSITMGWYFSVHISGGGCLKSVILVISSAVRFLVRNPFEAESLPLLYSD